MTVRSLITACWLLLVLVGGNLQADPIPISRVSDRAIGEYAEIFFEPGDRMAIEEVRSLFADNAGVKADSSILNFGIGAEPHWLNFVVENPTETTINKVFSVETAWLDNLAIYIYQDDTEQAEYAMGDSLVQTDRPIDSRFYAVEYAFKPGKTSIYLRVAGSDSMLLPIYLDDSAAFHKRFEFQDYSYGFLYGVLTTLMLYKLILFIRLQSAPYLFYTLYLASFIACNLAYTGHGFRWLWPQAIHWQQWANSVLMIVVGISGLLFASSFLKTRQTLPKLHWLIWGLSLAMLIGLGTAYYLAQIQTAVKLAFVFIVLISLVMVLLGVLIYRAGNPSAKIFLPAAVIAALTATITVLSVANIMPYSVWTYRAVDFGMVIEAILFALALALAEQSRRRELEHQNAQKIAHIETSSA